MMILQAAIDPKHKGRWMRWRCMVLSMVQEGSTRKRSNKYDARTFLHFMVRGPIRPKEVSHEGLQNVCFEARHAMRSKFCSPIKSDNHPIG